MKLNDPIFSDEAKAREYFESIRWPDGKPTARIAAVSSAFIVLKANLIAPA